MGYTISCNLTLPEHHPAHYWWPLVFEVLGRYQFALTTPGVDHAMRGCSGALMRTLVIPSWAMTL